MATESTALAKMDTANLILPPDVDTTGLSPEEMKQLAEFYTRELATSKQGVVLQPVRVKINKDACKFVDPFGNPMDELRGVLVLKHRARGYWIKGSDTSVPACSSMDGVTGRRDPKQDLNVPDGQACATCPLNQWGSGVDEAGNPTDGKACKEMRRLYLMLEGSIMPILLTLPPTSIREFDSFISARVQQKVADVAREVVIDLIPEKSGKFAYAVARFRNGNPVPPAKMLHYAKMRTDLQTVAEQAGLDLADDYGAEPTTATAGDDSPY